MVSTTQLLERYFPPGSFMRNVAIMLSGTASGPVISVLIMPVLTRLYTPEDFGVLTLFTSFLTLLVAMPTLRYEAAIPLPDNEEDAANLLVLSLVLLTIFSTLCGLVVMLTGKQIAGLLNADSLAQYLWLLPLALFAAGLFKVFSLWNTRLKRFGDIARGTIARPLGTGATSISLGFARAGVAGLLAGTTVGQFCAAGVIIYRAACHGLWRALKLAEPRRMRELITVYRQFPQFQLPATLLNSGSQQASQIVMAALYSMTIVGQYGVARRIFSMPMFLIVQAVAQVFLQRVAEEHNRGGDLRQLVNRLYLRLFLVGLAPTIVLFIIAPWACRVALGPEYEVAGHYTRLLIPWLFVAFVGSPTTSVFAVLNRQDIMLGYSAVLLVLRVAAVWLGWYLWADAYWSIALYALVGLAGNLFLMARIMQLSKPQTEQT
jgi:lipopolysaccharide exporter